MFIINVYDDKGRIGNSKMDLESYNWNHNILHSFGFIPDDPKYVYGIFMLEDSEEKKISDSEFTYKVSKYKLLLRNTNPDKQFDDTENSKWVKF